MPAASTNQTETVTPFVYLIHDVRDSSTAKSLCDLLHGVGIRTLIECDDLSGERHNLAKYEGAWLREVMSNIKTAMDVICLVTARSIDSPAMAYEAGLARGIFCGDLVTLFVGIDFRKAAGSPLDRSLRFRLEDESLSKLIDHLLGDGFGCELSRDAIDVQIAIFRTKVQSLNNGLDAVTSLTPAARKRKARELTDSSAKLFDDLKTALRGI